MVWVNVVVVFAATFAPPIAMKSKRRHKIVRCQWSGSSENRSCIAELTTELTSFSPNMAKACFPHRFFVLSFETDRTMRMIHSACCTHCILCERLTKGSRFFFVFRILLTLSADIFRNKLRRSYSHKHSTQKRYFSVISILRFWSTIPLVISAASGWFIVLLYRYHWSFIAFRDGTTARILPIPFGTWGSLPSYHDLSSIEKLLAEIHGCFSRMHFAEKFEVDVLRFVRTIPIF